MAISNGSPSSAPGAAAEFPATHWTVVLSAGQSESARSEEALTVLCRAYWYPLYAYLRRQGQTSHDAQDAVQSFFEHLLANHRLAQVHPAKGKFRSFLLASLRNFLADERRKQATRKRGGDVRVISLDAETAEERYRNEPVERQDPEKIYERRWALTVLERVLAQLKADYAEAGKAERFAQLEPFLLGEKAEVSYAEIGRRLDMSEGAVKMAVQRLRQRSRQLFRAEIAHTVATEGEIEDEVRHLLAVMAA